jgi:hypothetical protein
VDLLINRIVTQRLVSRHFLRTGTDSSSQHQKFHLHHPQISATNKEKIATWHHPQIRPLSPKKCCQKSKADFPTKILSIHF